MNTATTSPERDPAMIGRIAGFVEHLRINDFKIGPKETRDVATFLASSAPKPMRQACCQLKILLTGSRDEWQRFDDLFEAFWAPRGRERPPFKPSRSDPAASVVGGQGVWKNHFAPDQATDSQSEPAADAPGDTEISDGAEAKLIASNQNTRIKTDFRKFTDPEEILAAEKMALQLARAMRNRLSRRYRRAARGTLLDFRRTMRANQCHGGEPLTLIKKSRPDRPVRVVVLLDISGSMKTYSRFFLQFVKGLVCQWIDADAYLFHTKLIRVTDAVREKNSVKAMTKLALMADGFGGGTKLGDCLEHFNAVYAKSALNSRTVVIIISDGYDTGEPEHLARQLARLKRRAPRLVWLNPMLGWRDFEPITRSMMAAMPHIDHFSAANSIETLGAIEPQLARL